jgi:glutaredoxin
VVAVVDPMTSQIGPDQFREFVTPACTAVFESIREKGALSSFFVCGHAQQNVEAMCDCGPDNVSVDENIPLDFVRDVCLKRKVSFGGNMQLTSVLLLGKPADAMRNALACMEMAGKEGFILAPGCDLPYRTPPANLEAVARLVEDPYDEEVVKLLSGEKSEEDEQLDLTDYGQTDKVIVDVITLDSEACAPCQYMVEAVKRVTPEFEGIVDWREHKIKYHESLVFMASLMVRNVPTICIDGQITFVSRIPGRDELIEAIQKRIYEKLRLKLQRRRASIRILGDDEEKVKAIRENVEQAMTELGMDIDLIEVTDPRQIAAFGVAPVQTPAVILAKYELKSTRKIPEVAIVKEWIKDLR